MFRLYKIKKSARRSGLATQGRAPFVRFLIVVLSVISLAASTFGGVVTAQENSTSTQDSQQQDDSSEKTEEERRREELKQELEGHAQELQKLEAERQKYSNQARSHERDIALLENEIRTIQLQISRSRIIIQQTSNQIESNEQAISDLEERVERQKELLGKLLLSMYKLDDTSSVEIILTSDSLSEFFNDVAHVRNLQKGMKTTLEDVKSIKSDIEKKLEELDERAALQTKLMQSQATQRVVVDQKVAQKEKLLEESREQESQVASQAQEKEKTIAEIRNQLFVLEGTNQAIPFDQAYQIAKFAETHTGIRPAFLLSLIKQESGRGELFGTHTGSCTWRQDVGGLPVMHPRRDQPAFEIIAREVGFDPDTQLVSCPWTPGGTRPSWSWGGAMGPAQFIPSTWLAYKDRSADILGHPANPWNIRDAFVTAAVKLTSHGAAARTYETEWKSAMVYFAGGGWWRDEFSWYGDQVMERATVIQREIDKGYK